MVGMREDTVYARGVWVPFGHKRINEMFKLKELKHGSKFKKSVENPNHEKIIPDCWAGEVGSHKEKPSLRYQQRLPH